MGQFFESSPAQTGIYWVQNRVPEHGDLVLVSALSDQAKWAQTHGFVGDDWPLLKRAAGQSGDQICRSNDEILINEMRVATVMGQATRGKRLPEWAGCRVLSNDEVFLLNAHPKSLDGRYFGPTKIKDLDGVAVLLVEIN